jgi:hypothetical protein
MNILIQDEQKALVDIDSLVGIFGDCCKKPENLVNIGYLDSDLHISWQCVDCKRVFKKRASGYE